MTYMSGYMQGELLLAADAFLAGVFLAVCYDILRIFRNIADHSSFWVGIEDILYWCASGIYLFNLIYRENDGMIRIYVLLFTGLGALLYHAGPSMILVKYISAILRKIGRFLGIIGRPIRICRKRLKFWLVRVKIALYERKPIQRIRKRWNEKSKEKKISDQDRNG